VTKETRITKTLNLAFFANFCWKPPNSARPRLKAAWRPVFRPKSCTCFPKTGKHLPKKWHLRPNLVQLFRENVPVWPASCQLSTNPFPLRAKPVQVFSETGSVLPKLVLFRQKLYRICPNPSPVRSKPSSFPKNPSTSERNPSANWENRQALALARPPTGHFPPASIIPVKPGHFCHGRRCLPAKPNLFRAESIPIFPISTS